MKTSLIEKYNVPVPRYTSYPPANHFSSEFTCADHTAAIIESVSQQPEYISFYIHIPYCKHLCHYCGCNSYPFGEEGELEKYIEALHKEIDMVLSMLDKTRKIAQIHYGGGTPTAIPVKYLHELNAHLMRDFSLIENPEIAIECHPAYLTKEDWTALCDAGFNRFSLGIQDFNPEVLKCVNRRASQEKIEDIFTILRSRGAKINLDFIYGLPLQTPQSYRATIEKALSLQPDRIVTFSYAHVPWVNPRQKALEKVGLPSAELKTEIFNTGVDAIHNAGYKTIGMDHFVREDDELYLALNNKRLHRNFQGYCTRRTTGQVYAFGASAITQLTKAYVQNEKTPKDYIARIDAGELATIKGFKLSDELATAREVIETLMCNYAFSWSDIADNLNLSIEQVKQATNYSDQAFNELKDDGLITLSDDGVEITDEGFTFVRNVAAALDKLMINNTLAFSKPI